MSSNYTGMWQFQRYKTWKSGSSFGLIPGWSRPNVNGNTVNPNDYIGPERKARPLKIWRRQLQPTGGSGGSAASVDLANRPGGTVYKSTCACDVSGNNYIIDTSFNSAAFRDPTSADKIQNNGFVAVGGATTDGSYNIQTGIYDTNCVACNPESNVIKSGVTLLSKAYYSDTKGYLQSRCITYDQKLGISQIAGNNYIDANGNTLYPTNDSSGPQVFNTLNCPNPKGQNCSVTTIYKPNNRSFGTEGAVSSSSRIDKLKLDTITKNGNSFRSAWGAQGASAGNYHGTTTAPYFLKNKAQVCTRSIYHRNGNKTACFCMPIACSYE